jgi:hypothetical protein
VLSWARFLPAIPSNPSTSYTRLTSAWWGRATPAGAAEVRVFLYDRLHIRAYEVSGNRTEGEGARDGNESE